MSYRIDTARFGMMPNQAVGELNGKPFYFRARHGLWALRWLDPVSYEGEIIAEGVAGDAGWWNGEQVKLLLEALLKTADDGKTDNPEVPAQSLED